MKTRIYKVKTLNALKITALIILSVFLARPGKAQDKDTSTFKANGHVITELFADAYYKVHADTLNRGKTQYAGTSYPQNLVGFGIRRAYLGYEYNFAPKFTATVVFAYEGDVDIKNDRIPYLKYAYLTWKQIYPGANLVVGAQRTPTFTAIEEQLWNYRSVERTLLDSRGIASSNDVGASILGKFDKDGNFGYDAMVGNGTATVSEATVNPTTNTTGANIFKKFYGDLWAKFLDKKLVIQLYGDYYRTQLQPFQQSKTTLKAFVGYTTKPVTFGVTVFNQAQQNADLIKKPTGDTTNANAFGFSVFVRGLFIPNKLAWFARYDNYNPDTKYSSSDSYVNSGNNLLEQLIIVGIDYTPIKNIHFIPNLWVDTYHSEAPGVTGRVKNDADIVPRLTFAWNLENRN